MQKRDSWLVIRDPDLLVRS